MSIAALRPTVTRAPWTSREDGLVRSLAPLGTWELARHLQHRTPHAIRARANRLGLALPRTERRQGWRGRYPVPAHAHPFVRRMFEEMNKQTVLLYELSERAGVTRQAISQWRYSRTPHMTGLVACLNVLGLDLSVVRRRDDDDARLASGEEGR